MKKLLASLAILLTACSTTQQGQVLTSAAAIANTAMTDYSAYSSAQAGTLTPAQISAVATTASNDLNGIAALAQAYSGTGATPAVAKLQTGAANVATAAKIVALLPNAPITQANVNTLYQAAALVAAQSPGTTQASLPVRNAAFLRLNHADQRDATILFKDERALTFAANFTGVFIRP